VCLFFAFFILAEISVFFFFFFFLSLLLLSCALRFASHPPEPDEEAYNYLLRRKAVDFNVPLMNNLRVSQYIVEALKTVKEVKCESYEDYYGPNFGIKPETPPTTLSYRK
jgi:hypothetical protein